MYISFTGYLVIFAIVYALAETEYEPIIKNVGLLKSCTGKGVFLISVGVFLLDLRRFSDVYCGLSLIFFGIVNIIRGCWKKTY
jgi:uncharacterized paraquat-inducible protein A